MGYSPWFLLKNGGFRTGLEIAPNSLKRLLYARNGFLVAGIVCGDFGVNSQGSEIRHFQNHGL